MAYLVSTKALVNDNLNAPTGTKMIFNQTNAPLGWSKDTSSTDVALRLTDGTVGTGGSVAFETAFASQTIPTHQLVISEMPAHTHAIPATNGSSGGTYLEVNASVNSHPKATLSTGGDGTHGHGSIDLNVSYVDVIIATKD